MKLQNLRFFVAVVEYGGVTRAAERLRLSQPAVSAGIKVLEQELGCRLFDRGRDRRLRLTPEGERFRRHALAILRECDAATAALARSPRPRGLRLGLASTLAGGDLVQGLARLRARRPDVAFTYREGSAEQLDRWLAQKRLDAALTVRDPDAPVGRFLALREEPFVAVVPPGHRWAHREAIDFAEIAGEPFVLRIACELHRPAQARVRAAGLAVDVVARAGTDAMAFRLVEAGVGVALAPQDQCPPSLVAVAVDGLDLVRSVGLRWREEAVDATLVENVAALLAEAS